MERELPELAEIYREVADSLTWMRFCGILLGEPGATPVDVGETDQPVGPVWSTNSSTLRRPTNPGRLPTSSVTSKMRSGRFDR